MTLLQALFLGIIQGVTEFLPISSSGHLVLTPFLLGWEITPELSFPFGVLIQLGTLVAVFFYFRDDLKQITINFLHGLRTRNYFEHPDSALGWKLIGATIPAGAIGLLFNGAVKTAFQSPVLTAIALFVTAALLYFGENFGKSTRNIENLDWKDVLWIGFFQAMAIFPGVSRSGSTITGGMSRDMKRNEAARFSFLMSIPIMIAAGLEGILELFRAPHYTQFLPVLSAGFLTAAVTGYFSIAWLLKFLNHHSLKGFSIYCLLLGSLVLFLYYAI